MLTEATLICRRAIRLSLLSNISGKAGKFQGNDWVVELINLYIKVSIYYYILYATLLTLLKVTYGGKSSNRTAEHLIKESPLINVYREVLNSVESMCVLEKRATRHTEPDMTKTYEEMVKEMYSNNLFREVEGRDTVKEILDAFVEGHRIINKKGWAGCDTDNQEENLLNYDEDDIEGGIDTEE